MLRVIEILKRDPGRTVARRLVVVDERPRTLLVHRLRPPRGGVPGERRLGWQGQADESGESHLDRRKVRAGFTTQAGLALSAATDPRHKGKAWYEPGAGRLHFRSGASLQGFQVLALDTPSGPTAQTAQTVLGR